MHIHLREGEVDPLFGQLFVEFFVVFEEHIPVIAVLHPGSRREVDRAVGKGRDPYEMPIVQSTRRVSDVE